MTAPNGYRFALLLGLLASAAHAEPAPPASSALVPVTPATWTRASGRVDALLPEPYAARLERGHTQVKTCGPKLFFDQEHVGFRLRDAADPVEIVRDTSLDPLSLSVKPEQLCALATVIDAEAVWVQIEPSPTPAEVACLARWPVGRLYINIGEPSAEGLGEPSAETLDALWDVPTLVSLTLLRAEPAAVHGAVSRLTGLEQLSLGWTRIGDRELGQLRTLKRLRRLRLDQSPLTEAGVAHLRAFPALRALALRGATISLGAAEIIGGLTGLRELALTESGLTDAHVARLVGLGELRALSLNLNRVTGRAFADIARLERLQGLHLDAVDVERQDITLLAELPDLRALALGGLGDDEVRALAELSSLRVLWSHSKGVSEAAWMELEALPHLRYLDIRRLSQAAVDQWKLHPNLQVMRIQGNWLDRVDGEWIADRAPKPNCEDLPTRGR